MPSRPGSIRARCSRAAARNASAAGVSTLAADVSWPNGTGWPSAAKELEAVRCVGDGLRGDLAVADHRRSGTGA